MREDDIYTFKFTLVANQSADKFEEWGTGNFQYPFAETIEIRGLSLEGAIANMKEKCKSFSNTDWFWEVSHDGTEGWISCGNDSDGLMLKWEFELE